MLMRYNYERLRSSIKDHLGRENITQAEMAKRCNCTTASLNMILTGKREPKVELISKITNALNIPIHEFFIFEDTDNMRLIEPPRYVPLISWTHAGKFSEKNDINHVGIGEPVPYYGTDRNAFALVVEGDSMEPEFHAGERIVVSPNAHINSGNYCVVEINDEASLKKVIFKDSLVILKALNIKYEDIYIESDNKTFRIIGRVVEKSKKY